MGDKKQEKKRKKINWAMWATILTGIVVIINIILITDIRITIPRFQKAAYFGQLLEKATVFQIKPRNVSPLYFIETNYRGSDSVRYKDELKFSVKIKEKGKKYIEEPEFRIYMVDAIGDLRAIYPYHESMIYEENPVALLGFKDDIERTNLRKSISFSFKMPPIDQKVIGIWKIFIYVYDGSTNELVSYHVHDFDVTDEASAGIFDLIIGIVVITLATFLYRIIYNWILLTRKERKKQK